MKNKFFLEVGEHAGFIVGASLGVGAVLSNINGITSDFARMPVATTFLTIGVSTVYIGLGAAGGLLLGPIFNEIKDGIVDSVKEISHNISTNVQYVVSNISKNINEFKTHSNIKNNIKKIREDSINENKSPLLKRCID